MMTKEINDLFYVCSLIEFVGRMTKNTNADIVHQTGKKGFIRELDITEVNHCLSFEQVGDETIEIYGIKNMSFDSVGTCKYRVPLYLDLGVRFDFTMGSKNPSRFL